MATEKPDKGVAAVKEELRRKRRIRRLILLGTVVGILFLTYLSLSYLKFSLYDLLSARARREFPKFVGSLFPPNFEHLTPYTRENEIKGLAPIWVSITQPDTLIQGLAASEPGAGYNIAPAAIGTIAVGLSGTVLGFPLALLFGVLGTERVTPFPFNFIFRGAMSTIRAIPAIIWVLIYIPLFGISPSTGVMAIGTDTIGNLGRLFSEELEEIDEGPIEAIRSTGAGRAQVVVFGMLSQVTNSFIAWTLYILEINTRIAISLGVLGVGGLGMYIQGEIDKFAYPTAAAGIASVIVIVLSIEFVSTRIRARLRPSEHGGRSIWDMVKGLFSPQKWVGTRVEQPDVSDDDEP